MSNISLTLHGSCCDDYVQYVKEMGEEKPGTLLRIGKHFFAHNGRCDAVALLSTRKKRDSEWVQGFRAARIKVPLCFLNPPDICHIQSLLSTPKVLRTASRADVCDVIRLPSQCLYDFAHGIVRAGRVYRALSGECAICSAMIGPNLLLASGMVVESALAADEREHYLSWIRTHRPDLWQTMQGPVCV